MLVSILISRQALTICRNMPWIQQTLAVCKKISENNDTLLTSIGQNTWNFQLFCGTLLKLKMRIIVPAIDREIFEKISNHYKEQFKGNENNVEYVFIKCNSNDRNNIRDQYIINNSERIFPISIRKNGFFYKSLKSNEIIDTTFEINHVAHPCEKRKKQYQPIDSKKFNNLENYLFHWTRKPKENWPNENQFDYYMSILRKDDGYRTAFDTLCNILDNNLIYSSSRHASKTSKMVSFTGSPIYQFLDLMKWRNKYNEMSYEPYGIGINREDALRIGFKKVLYCSRDEFDKLTIDEKKLYHSSGIKTDWSEENEYRFFCDLDLNKIPKEKKICICQNSDESSYVEKKYGIKSYSLY